MSTRTTGGIRSTQQRVLGAARMEPVVGDERRVRGRPKRQVEDSTKAIPRSAREPRHRLVRGLDRGVRSAGSPYSAPAG